MRVQGADPGVHVLPIGAFTIARDRHSPIGAAAPSLYAAAKRHPKPSRPASPLDNGIQA